MINLHNPHSEDCTITFKGKSYTVSAGETVEIPEDVATYWKNQIHKFLEIVETIKELTKIRSPKIKE